MTGFRQAWWTEAGPDTCDFCSVHYYAESGYYCSRCDNPVCASCVVTVFETRMVLCPVCNGEGEA